MTIRIYGHFCGFGGFGRRKTNPIRTQFYLAPRFIWGLKDQFEKTNPICVGFTKCKVFNGRILWQYSALRGTKKQSQFKAKFKAVPDLFGILP